MIKNIINYSFKQKLIDFDLREKEKNFIEIIFNSKKFIIQLSEITSSGKGRTNSSELRRQISPSIKKRLIPYDAEEYVAVLLGYHSNTNTFTIWENELETKTTQSLFTRIETLESAKEKGFDIHVYKKNKKWSFSFNIFLLPLVLENIDLIFTKDVFKNFSQKIKHYNKPYDLDDLIMCIDLYSRKSNNLNKNDKELLEISDLCKLKSKLLNYYPYINFYPGDPKKFRNTNGIYKKLQNLVKLDPSKIIKGLTGGSEAREKKVWNLFLKNGTLDKENLYNHSKLIKKNINSGNIYSLIGIQNFSEINEDSNSQKYIKINQKNLLQDYDFEKNYENRKINSESFFDPIDHLNAIDKATEQHEKILKKLAKILSKKKLIHKNSKNIDLYSEFNERGKMFEAKTFTEENLKRQLRHAIIQLKEYYFFYSKYKKIIKYKTDLFLILNQNPLSYLDKEFINFIESEKICLCWFQEEDKIITLDTVWNKNAISWLR
jgi:hypothetical protein